MAMLWKSSKSVLLRLYDSSSSIININSAAAATRRRCTVSIVGRTEDEVKALFEEYNIKRGRSFNSVEEKEKFFRIWKCVQLIDHPDPNDKLAYRNVQKWDDWD